MFRGACGGSAHFLQQGSRDEPTDSEKFLGAQLSKMFERASSPRGSKVSAPECTLAAPGFRCESASTGISAISRVEAASVRLTT
jgi:hypothetical protein